VRRGLGEGDWTVISNVFGGGCESDTGSTIGSFLCACFVCAAYLFLFVPTLTLTHVWFCVVLCLCVSMCEGCVSYLDFDVGPDVDHVPPADIGADALGGLTDQADHHLGPGTVAGGREERGGGDLEGREEEGELGGAWRMGVGWGVDQGLLHSGQAGDKGGRYVCIYT
jgi:hypothetical protein